MFVSSDYVPPHLQVSPGALKLIMSQKDAYSMEGMEHVALNLGQFFFLKEDVLEEIILSPLDVFLSTEED